MSKYVHLLNKQRLFLVLSVLLSGQCSSFIVKLGTSILCCTLAQCNRSTHSLVLLLLNCTSGGLILFDLVGHNAGFINQILSLLSCLSSE